MSGQSRAAEPEQGRVDLEMALHYVLLVGVTVSIAIMLVGLVLLAFNPSQAAHHTLSVSQAFPLAVQGDPGAVLTVGVIVLMATPALRVVTCLIGFLAERDWLYSGIALLVALVLTISIFIAR